jgi:mono/diheme cytochrome c family protein
MTDMVFSMRTLAIILTVSLGAAVVLTACEPGDQPGPEYMPDMAHGPAYKAFMPNEVMRNGITLQRPVAGTIKRGAHPFHYGKGDLEAARAGVELTDPFHPTENTLARGKALFEIYCLVCHGEQGKGDGPISSKIPPPPSYKSERLMAYPPGRIFHIVTMGYNKMPSYAVQLTPEERWLVVTYVRSVLQGLPEAPPGAGEGATLDTAAPASEPGDADKPTDKPAAPAATDKPANTPSASAGGGAAASPGAAPAAGLAAKPATPPTPAPAPAAGSIDKPTAAQPAIDKSAATAPAATDAPGGH